MDALIPAAARLFMAVAGLAGVFQVALLLGAPFGVTVFGGRWPGRLPIVGRAFSAILAMVLFWSAAMVAGASGIGPTPVSTPVIWLVFGFCMIALLAVARSPSRIERSLWLPVLAVLAVCASLVAT